MTKIELEELFKIIDTEIGRACAALAMTNTAFDQQYQIGKKHALQDIKKSISYQHQHLLGAQE